SSLLRRIYEQRVNYFCEWISLGFRHDPSCHCMEICVSLRILWVMLQRECDNCGENIPAKRLEALPNAKFCIKCQGKRESSGLFQRHMIDIQPEIESWECQNVTQTLVRGSDV